MTKPNVHDMHKVMAAAGIPLDSVHWDNLKKVVEIRYLRGATDQQQQAAQKIADEWDQEAFDAAKARSYDDLPTVEAIHAGKTVADLKAMALQMRAYIDTQRD